MASDIKISELNEITRSSELDFLILNDRENTGDDGITKKIQLGNLLPDNIVKTANIQDCAVTTNKIAPFSITNTRIAPRSIGCCQISCQSITSTELGSSSVDPRIVNSDCTYTVAGLNVNRACLSIGNLTHGCLDVASGITSYNGVRYCWPSQNGSPNHFLRNNGSGLLEWAEAVPGDGTSLVFSQIFPVGTIVPWAGESDVPDDKWIKLDGTHRNSTSAPLGTFDGTLYPELSAVLGDTWGTRDGNNFYLPNFAGRMPIGTGSAVDANSENRTFNKGDISGAFRHTLNIQEMPRHCHTAGAANGNVNNQNCSPFRCVNDDREDVIQTDTVGGDSPHNNMQPYAVTTYIIKAKNDDIQQFNPTIGPGLSARDANGVTSTLTLTSTELGIKINNNGLVFDTENKLKVSGDLNINSITFTDNTVLSTYMEPAYWNVLASNVRTNTTPAQMRADRLNSNFNGEWTHYSRGSFKSVRNDGFGLAHGSMMLTMYVHNTTDAAVTRTLYKFAHDDSFYLYVDDVEKLAYPTPVFNLQSDAVTFDIPVGIHRIDIVLNDVGQVNNYYDIQGDIVDPRYGIYFVPRERALPYPGRQ